MYYYGPPRYAYGPPPPPMYGPRYYGPHYHYGPGYYGPRYHHHYHRRGCNIF